MRPLNWNLAKAYILFVRLLNKQVFVLKLLMSEFHGSVCYYNTNIVYETCQVANYC